MSKKLLPSTVALSDRSSATNGVERAFTSSPFFAQTLRERVEPLPCSVGARLKKVSEQGATRPAQRVSNPASKQSAGKNLDFEGGDDE